MRLGERAADLAQEVDHPRVGAGTEAGHEPLEIDPLQILHRVIERPALAAPVVVDGDGVRVGQKRRHLDLALEALDRQTVALVGAEQLERGGAPKQSVPRQVDLAHRAAAETPLEDVLAELPHLGLGQVRAASRPPRQEPRGHRGRAGHRHQGEQRAEDSLERPHRLEGLVGVDLGQDAEAPRVDPGPGAHHGHAAVVAVRGHGDTGAPGDRVRRPPRQRLRAPLRLGPKPLGRVSAGIADGDPQGGVVFVGADQAGAAEVLGKAAAGDHLPLTVEGVGLPRSPGPGGQQRRRELALIDPEAESARAAWQRHDDHDSHPPVERPERQSRARLPAATR